MSVTYRLLIHSRLHEALQGDARGYLVPLAKTLSHLQLGYWGGGTRVKRLRGHAAPVFEARLNAGDRVIFTLAHTASSEPPHDPAPHILVWDILSHDGVDRRRFNLQPEASFVEFPAVADCTIAAPPAHAPVRLGDDVADPASLLAAVQGPPPETGRADDVGEAIRWYVLDPTWVLDDAAWQAVLDAGDAEAELKLTREQYDVLMQSGPVLLSGAAGSGKTTLTVHWLARQASMHPSARVLYVTYSELLLDQVRRSFRSLLRVRGTALPSEPIFLTFPELYRQLAGVSQAPLRYPRFAAWYTRVTSRTDAPLAWEEIRGILKGACLDLERPALARADYEALGRKRAPLFAGERPRLAAVGQRYQQWLNAERLVDDIDLARAAWRARRARPDAAYAAVVCDEVQDLTEIEMNLLLDLSGDRTFRGLLITGDPQQIVNPSGFRWAELRSLFLRAFKSSGQAVPDVRRLTRNFRSVRGIVALANAVLAIQRERTGRSDDDLTEEGVTHGPAPFVVDGAPGDILAAAREFGPRCAVLTARAEQAEALRRALGSTRVFDVASSKGLEFDAVVVWDLLAPDEPAWRELLAGTADCKENPAMRRVLHHAYVAVTRARQWLAVVETGGAAELWAAPRLRACLERDAPAALRAILATAATPEQWAREAGYYADRRRYLQAAECYRRAGRHAEAEGAEAMGLDESGRYREAAERYLRLGRRAEAAAAYGRAGDADHAASMFRELGQPERAEAVLLEHWRRTGAWSRAAELHEKRGELAEAAEAYGRAGHAAHAGRLRIELARAGGDWAEVGRLETERHQWAAAAEAYTRAGRERDATACRAHQAEHMGNVRQAAELWRAAGNEERARKLVATVDDLEQRARSLEREDSHSLRRALALWQEVQKAQASERTAGRIAAIEAELRQDWLAAAEAYFRGKVWSGVERTARAMRATRPRGADGRPRAEERNDRRARTLGHMAAVLAVEEARGSEAAWKRACGLPPLPELQSLRAEVALRAGRTGDAVRVYAGQERWEDAERVARQSGDACLIAEFGALRAERENNLAQAEQLWRAAGQPLRAAEASARRLEGSGDLEGALRAWEDIGRIGEARRLRRRLTALRRRASGRALPSVAARAEAMVRFAVTHPGCTRKDAQAALQYTSGEALQAWYTVEKDKRVEWGWMRNTKVYGPPGWIQKRKEESAARRAAPPTAPPPGETLLLPF